MMFEGAKRIVEKINAAREGKKTTDVGLEPTASALGGLRATIAPTGRVINLCKILNLTVLYTTISSRA
jgi:hypothetical protein